MKAYSMCGMQYSRCDSEAEKAAKETEMTLE